MFNISPTRSSTEVLRKLLFILALGSMLLASGCDSSSTTDTTDTTSEVTDADFEATDWTDETHSKSADPNFDEVFDDTQVKRLDFVITAERWQSMLDDMTATYGEFGQPSGSSP